jgi:transcriptional regulator with XRE-family HTH domain
MSIGEVIQARRRQLGLGQRALAERLRVTQQTVSRWERSDVLPPPRQFLALAAALDASPTAVLRSLGYVEDGEPVTVGELLDHLRRLPSEEVLTVAIEALAELRRRGSL